MSTAQTDPTASHPEMGPTLMGHPTGLFTLFFAEMWERFSYYGMRALLMLYLMKGFLGYGDQDAYAIYGAYGALVYMMPFFGGMLADRLLGARRAVIVGGLLMAAGHLMMTLESSFCFFTALGLLICGNGFFKPNISSIVGTLYKEGDHKRDGGFTIFYMGVNLGAAMSPLLCGYIGETYGWHYGFGLATIGMLVGIAVFVVPTRVAQALIGAGAVVTALGLLLFKPDSALAIGFNVFVAIVLLIAGAVSVAALGRGGLPQSAGGAADAEKLRRPMLPPIATEWIVSIFTLIGLLFLAAGEINEPNWGFSAARLALLFVFVVFAARTFTSQTLAIFGMFVVALRMVAYSFWSPAMSEIAPGTLEFVLVNFADSLLIGVALSLSIVALLHKIGQPLNKLSAEWTVYLGTFLAVGIVALIVSGFAPFTEDNRPISLVTDAQVKQIAEGGPIMKIASVIVKESSRPAGLVLLVAGIGAFTYLTIEAFRLSRIARQRMFVVLILTFFSLLFWAFFEQAGSSLTNFADRNVDRVGEARQIAEDDIGTTIQMRISPSEGDEGIRNLPLLSQEQFGHKNAAPGFTAQLEKAIRSVEESKGEGRQQPEKIDEIVADIAGHEAFTISGLTYLRDAAGQDDASEEMKTVEWTVHEDNVGMGVGGDEIPASIFQCVNPICIIIFGLLFTMLWAWLDKRGLDPNTPVKFSLGLFQLGLGFMAFWYGAQMADDRGMVLLPWLLLGYLLHTTGELCISPVGLSMVTKLSPKQLVSTVMGGWFLATGISSFLAAIIAQFTGAENGESNGIPVPLETVNVFGNVYWMIALAAIASGVICLGLSPLLSKWMHEEAIHDEGDE